MSDLSEIEKVQLLAEIVEVDAARLRLDTELSSLPSWDSMAALSLIVVMEERFGRQDLTSQMIRRFITVGDVVREMVRQ